MAPGLQCKDHLGGVGVVIVRKVDDEDKAIVEQGGFTVVEVLSGAGIAQLASPPGWAAPGIPTRYGAHLKVPAAV